MSNKIRRRAECIFALSFMNIAQFARISEIGKQEQYRKAIFLKNASKSMKFVNTKGHWIQTSNAVHYPQIEHDYTIAMLSL